MQVLLIFLLALLSTLHPSLAGLGPAFDTDPLERTRLTPDQDWNWGRDYSRLSVDNQRVTNILSHVFEYNFTLPRVQLQRGLTYLGSACRLRRVVRDLLSRKDVKVGVIGGSVSWGQGSSRRGVTDWFSTLSSYLVRAFPSSNVTTRNGCTPGVPSSYMIMCLELSVDPDVDLVFVEYTLNDGHDTNLYDNRVVRDVERLLRRVLALPRRPAVVLLHHVAHFMAAYPPGHPKHAGAFRPFHESSEDAQGALSQYYDAQALSQRTGLYRLAGQREEPGFLWENMFADFHPGDRGHKVMADLAVHLIQQVALGLLVNPYAAADEEVVREALPRPMYPGNLPPSSPMCLMNDAFKSLVVSASGWEYVNEGSAEKPKPGYVATTPGSVLRLRINTDRAGLGDAAGQQVHVFFHHLRSYNNMGVAKFSCVSGCTCDPLDVDAHILERVSQLYLAGLAVSQAAACEVEVEVLPRSSSGGGGGHKFKLAGVVVSERPGEPGKGITSLGGHNQAFGIRVHNGEEGQVTVNKAGVSGTDRRRLRRHRRRGRSLRQAASEEHQQWEEGQASGQGHGQGQLHLYGDADGHTATYAGTEGRQHSRTHHRPGWRRAQERGRHRREA